MDTKSVNILVVEDESIVALDIKSNLEKLGYQVCALADTAELALQYSRELAPDLVLMDIRLKGEKDGIEVATEIKHSLQIPVVYLTAHADQTTLERAKITEPFGYIVKPFEAVELRVAVELALYKFHTSKKELAVAESTAQKKVSSITTCEKTRLILNLLQNNPLLQSVPDNELVHFAKQCSLRKFTAGKLIAFEGDVRDKGFLVISGRVALLKTSLSGKELIVDLLLPNELFGIALALETEPYSITARTQLASEIVFAPKPAIVQLLESHPELYRAFVDIVSSRLKKSQDTARELAHERVEQRIASALNSLSPDGSSAKQPRICITRQEIADLTGTTVETAIRVTKTMERDGLLNLSQNGVILIRDRERLQAIANH